MKTSKLVAAVCSVILKVVVTVVVVLAIYRGAMLCYEYGYRIFAEPAVSTGEGRTVTVTVTEKMSPREIGALFLSKGLIRDDKLFVLQYHLSEFKKNVKPGTFELTTAMTVEEMMEVMASDPAKEDE